MLKIKDYFQEFKPWSRKKYLIHNINDDRFRLDTSKKWYLDEHHKIYTVNKIYKAVDDNNRPSAANAEKIFGCRVIVEYIKYTDNNGIVHYTLGYMPLNDDNPLATLTKNEQYIIDTKIEKRLEEEEKERKINAENTIMDTLLSSYMFDIANKYNLEIDIQNRSVTIANNSVINELIRNISNKVIEEFKTIGIDLEMAWETKPSVILEIKGLTKEQEND